MANAAKDQIEQTFRSWPGVLLLIRSPADPLAVRRAAAFAFGLPGGGFAWVEPTYLDPFGPSAPAFHSRPRAELSFLNEARPDLGFAYVDPETEEDGLVYPWREDDWPAVPELEAYLATLAARETTVAAERERLMPALVAQSRD